MSELVSIIMPCFNNEAYIAEAIESALNQTYPHCEVIVINDGSTDNSLNIINRYADRIQIIDQSNHGACHARNQGIARARGAFIKFLDGDDILFADCVEKQMACDNKADVIVFGDACYFFEDGSKSEPPAHSELAGLVNGANAGLESILNHLVLTSTTLYPKRVLKVVGGFNEAVLRGQETELHLRIYLSGFDFEYQKYRCYLYRQHETESRISVKNRKVSYHLDFDNFKVLCCAAIYGPRAKDRERNVILLGHGAWRAGREHLRRGNTDLASQFFDYAKLLTGNEAVYGSATYRALVKTFGPHFAESFGKLKSRVRLARK